MRRLIFAAVAAGHLIVILLLEQSHSLSRTPAEHEIVTMVAYFLDTEPQIDRTQKSQPRAVSPAPTRGPRRTTAPQVAVPPETPTTESPSNAITDWHAEAHAAAEESLQRGAAVHHPFTHVFPSQPAASEPGVYGSEKDPKSGTVEHFDDGSDRYWVSGNCYLDFDRKPHFAAWPGMESLQMVKCKPARTGGGENLFMQQAPGYLKTRPDTEPAK